MSFAENAITSAPITGGNVYFDEYGLAHDRKAETRSRADKLRAMTDEELAAFLSSGCPPTGCRAEDMSCVECWRDWLSAEGDV